MKPLVERIENIIRSMSLKTRMALTVSGIFVLFAVGMASFTLSYFEYEFKKTISRHLYSIASMQADNVDNKLSTAQKALMARADTLPSAAISDPEQAQRFLDQTIALRATFDNGLFLFTKTGRLIAETPYLPNRRGKDLSYREYFQKTISTGKPVISDPYISTHTPGHPAIILTAPIFDKQGNIVAVFGGSFDLLGKNFLKDVAEAKIGESGYIYVFNKDRTLIIHPDEKRIMTIAATPGVNPAYDKAIAGFDGSDQTVNSQGVDMLVSFKHLKTTDWGVAATSPLEEAYHPLFKAKSYFIVAALAGMLAMIAVVWFLMKRFLMPLQSLVHEVSALPAKPVHQRVIHLGSDKEIAILESAFNGMLATLANQQEALQESETNFRALADNANDGMVIVSEEGKFIYANRRLAEITGFTITELLQFSLQDIAHPAGLVEMMARHTRTLGGRNVPKHHETYIVGKELPLIPAEVSNSRTFWKSKPVELIIIRDITDRKLAEEKLQAERKLFIAGPTVVLKWRDDKEWPVEYVSPNILYQFGYHPEEFTSGNRGFASIIHPDDISHIESEVRSLREMEKTFVEQEYRIKRVDGGYRCIYDLTVLHNQSIDGTNDYLAYIIDITERKDAEEKLARTEKIATRISEIAKIGSWEYNVITQLMYCSEDMCKLFGLEKKLHGHPYQHFIDTIHPDDRNSVNQAFQDTLKNDTPFSVIYRMILPDKSERTLFSEAELVRDTAGTPVSMVGFAQDVTGRKG